MITTIVFVLLALLIAYYISRVVDSIDRVAFYLDLLRREKDSK